VSSLEFVALVKPILVIADDITGAAEIAGIAHEHGISAAIGVRQLPLAVEARAIVIDTDTRHLRESEAAQRVTDILSRLDLTEFDLVYKKTDSVLRGSVAAELRAVMNPLCVARSLLVPQNPSRGRVIDGCEYRVNGVPLDQTTFAADPAHPATSADVRRLLDPDAKYDVSCIQPDELMPTSGIVIGGGTSLHDLRRWSARVDAITLPAGGAEFFTAILESRGFSKSTWTSPALDLQNHLMVCGSASDSSRSFVDAAASWTCAMPDVLFTTDEAAEEITAWRDTIIEQMNASGRAATAIRQPAQPDRAEKLRKTMAEVVARVLAIARPRTLLIEGGATAAAVLERLGWRTLSVEGQLSPGVVALRPAESPQQLLVLKPGSYPWPTGVA
jgi:uncharacterized protein YgbK (DUF1537 family)